MVHGYAPADETTHRQAGDGAMVTVSYSAVFGIDHRDELLRYQHVDIREIEHAARAVSHAGPGDESLAAVHYDKHRHALLGSNQVVHDVVDLALDCPAGLIFSAAVIEVQHGVALVGLLLILGGNIDVAGSPCLGEFRPVSLHADLSVGNILRQIEVYTDFGNLDGAGHHAAAIEQLARRVGHMHAVYVDEIVVETGNLRLAGDLPDAVGILGHGVDMSEVELHAFSTGGIHLEGYGQVRIDLGILLAKDIGAGRSRLRDEADHRFFLAGRQCGGSCYQCYEYISCFHRRFHLKSFFAN